MSETDDSFGFVQRRRNQLGMSWRHAAATAGLSPATWAEIEMCDGARGSDEDLAKVETALNIPPGILKAFNHEQTDPGLIEIRGEAVELVKLLTSPELLGEQMLEDARLRLLALQARLHEAAERLTSD